MPSDGPADARHRSEGDTPATDSALTDSVDIRPATATEAADLFGRPHAQSGVYAPHPGGLADLFLDEGGGPRLHVVGPSRARDLTAPGPTASCPSYGALRNAAMELWRRSVVQSGNEVSSESALTILALSIRDVKAKTAHRIISTSLGEAKTDVR